MKGYGTIRWGSGLQMLRPLPQFFKVRVRIIKNKMGITRSTAPATSKYFDVAHVDVLHDMCKRTLRSSRYSYAPESHSLRK